MQRHRWLIERLIGQENAPDGQRGVLWRLSSKKANFLKVGSQSFKDKVHELEQDWYGYDDKKDGLTEKLIQTIRTDLDSFTTAEAKILENHGYYFADIAIRRHVPMLAADDAAFRPPHPEYLDKGHEGNQLVEKSLKRSGSRWFSWKRWFNK